jgi:hypothetical protein
VQAALKLRINSETRAQLDIVVNGVMSSSFGGIGYNIDQVLSKGNSELVFMYSRVDKVREWYRANQNYSADEEEDEDEDQDNQDNKAAGTKKPKYPPHIVVHATLDFNKETITAVTERLRKQQENAIKKELSSRDDEL